MSLLAMPLYHQKLWQKVTEIQRTALQQAPRILHEHSFIPAALSAKSGSPHRNNSFSLLTVLRIGLPQLVPFSRPAALCCQSSFLAPLPPAPMAVTLHDLCFPCWSCSQLDLGFSSPFQSQEGIKQPEWNGCNAALSRTPAASEEFTSTGQLQSSYKSITHKQGRKEKPRTLCRGPTSH